MTTKEEKPTLAGVTLKTRKRNIVVPVDPASFANAVIAIYTDAAEGCTTLEEELDAGTKSLENANSLEFSRYGDTLFEVLFAGGMLAAGGKYASEEGTKLKNFLLGAEPNRDAIMPYIKVFVQLTRRRPFLVRGLEATIIKLLLTSEFFDEDNRKRLAIALALVLSNKIAVQGENIFAACFNDRLVSKGTILEVLTFFFQEFLAHDSLDDLVTILARAKVSNRLLDYLPSTNRTAEEFERHFTEAGLAPLVEWNKTASINVRMNELLQALTEGITADPPMPVADLMSDTETRMKEGHLPPADVIRVIWVAIIASMNMTGKNQQQIMQGVVAKIKMYHKLLNAFSGSGKLELSLLVTVQVQCYEDNRLLKLFADIVRLLYDADIIEEDTIQHWYKKASHPKGRNVFLKDIEPFIKWLEEAEEDSEEDDE